MKKYVCPECGWENFRFISVPENMLKASRIPVQCTKCKSVLLAPHTDDFHLYEGFLSDAGEVMVHEVSDG